MGVVFALGPSLVNVILVMAVTRWVQFARIVRADVLSIREREFVSGARARGNRSMRLLLRHVLPNALTPIIVVATLELAFMIIYESALSFLGLGVQPPTPTWGWMLSDGRNYIATAWWLATFRGSRSLTVLAVNPRRLAARHPRPPAQALTWRRCCRWRASRPISKRDWACCAPSMA
jgi:peptide/nickel transport system permease protein